MDDKKYPNTISLLIRTVDLFMYRIKAFQMQKNIYNNASGANREIAYFSLGWKLGPCLDGFVDNMESKQVSAEVLNAHHLDKEWISNPSTYRTKIIDTLKANTGYADIPQLSEADWKLAKDVGTGLSRLSEKKIDCLIKHAEALTELQLKLYCPSLFEKKI